MKDFARKFDGLFSNSFFSLVLLSGLLLTLIVVTLFLQQNSLFRLGRRAAGNVDISLIAVNPTNAQVAPGGTITIDLQVNTGTQTLSAADLNVTIPDQFEFVSFTKGNFLNATGINADGSTGSLPTIDINSEASPAIPYFSDNNANLIVGVPCDECYIGSAGSGGYAECPTNPPPKCYAKKGSGQLATLVLKAKTSASAGTYDINFNTGATKAAAIEVVGTNDDNVVNQLNNLAVTIVEGAAGCQVFDVVDPVGTIDTADIQNLIIRHHNSSVGDGRYDANYDIVDPVGVVDTADIQNIIILYHNTSCLQ
jgi:hypothetical protein